MEWLPMCAKLEEAVGARNWLDIVFLYCQKFLAEHRDFSIKVNRLVGQMNEACQDRIAFVRELESVAGVAVIAKTVVFLTEMMDKEGFRELQLRDLEKEARERALEIEMFVQKLMQYFVDELDILEGRSVPGKMVEFMKQLQGKDILNLMKLQILGRKFEPRARENDIFIDKLKGNMDY
ncbi:hypothetical protein Tco_1004279 [Tanacetum coccineum]|uniref:Uncharacterized protein n=1 Tax=Tanacetum coccineum TaxID=301880 RepID=A0ABQ5FBU0_9ASTR